LQISVQTTDFSCYLHRHKSTWGQSAENKSCLLQTTIWRTVLRKLFIASSPIRFY